MRNIILALIAFIPLNSCRLLLQKEEKRTYKRLTDSEKLSLSQGNIIEKIDTVKRSKHMQYGPIRVAKNQKGISVTRSGIWKYYTDNRLVFEENLNIGTLTYYSKSTVSSRTYNLSKFGALAPSAPGDTIEMRNVVFKNGNSLDTAYVYHDFSRINKHGRRKSIRAKSFISNDWKGIKRQP